MSHLRQRMMQDLELAGYARGTRRHYLAAIQDFAFFHHRSPVKMGQTEVRSWVEHLRQSGISPQRQRQHLAALKFLYSKTLGRPEVVAFLSWPRGKPKLPAVLSIHDVSRVLGALSTAKYRVFFITLYATGLRMSEASRLETGDVDGARHVIQVRHGKGGRQRLVTLSERLLSILRTYWWLERPKPPYLFPSRAGGPLNEDTARAAFRKAVVEAGLDRKKITPHVLRHSYATHMLEYGTDLRVLQVLLGHGSVRSTTRYAQVSTKLLSKAPCPLEQLTETG